MKSTQKNFYYTWLFSAKYGKIKQNIFIQDIQEISLQNISAIYCRLYFRSIDTSTSSEIPIAVHLSAGSAFVSFPASFNAPLPPFVPIVGYMLLFFCHGSSKRSKRLAASKVCVWWPSRRSLRRETADNIFREASLSFSAPDRQHRALWNSLTRCYYAKNGALCALGTITRASDFLLDKFLFWLISANGSRITTILRSICLFFLSPFAIFSPLIIFAIFPANANCVE